MVGEGDVVEQEPRLVRVERRPAAVLALHAPEPANGTLDGNAPTAIVRVFDLTQAHGDDRGVVEVGVVGVVELERPAAGREPRALDLPVARLEHLAVEEPVSGADQGRMPGGEPRGQERVDRQRGVPHG
jgi:hypothetical protein